MTNLEILDEMAKFFFEKSPKGYRINFAFFIDSERYDISILENKISIKLNTDNTIDKENIEFIWHTTHETLEKLYNRELSAFTAKGKSKKGDISPINFDEYENESIFGIPDNDLLNRMMILDRFLNYGNPEIIKIDKQHSRLLHDTNIVALHADAGLMIYCSIDPKGTLIEPKIQTSVIVLDGIGQIESGLTSFTIEKGFYYYFVPKGEVKIKNITEKDLSILYMSEGYMKKT